MRIDNNVHSVKPHQPADAKVSAGKAGQTASTRDQSLTSVDPNSIDSLLHSVDDATKVRESAVNEAKAKVQNGEYLARQSAVDTASAILDL